MLEHGPRDAGAIALTFDDGPGAVTADVLEALADHGARATFHLLGARAAAGAPLVRRIAREGHEVGVHGWSHRVMARTPLRSLGELARARLALEALSGARPRGFRPPFGATSRRLELAAAALGLRTVGWDVDPRDHEEPGAAAIGDRVLAAIRPGSIVLLHDDRPELAPTAEALHAILPALAARGLRAVPVAELLSADR
jgi:peptidoglycan/xylan/chitin deacetylase (PgdA/CDA1 family)